jgi:hypothetical protein
MAEDHLRENNMNSSLRAVAACTLTLAVAATAVALTARTAAQASTAGSVKG